MFDIFKEVSKYLNGGNVSVDGGREGDWLEDKYGTGGRIKDSEINVGNRFGLINGEVVEIKKRFIDPRYRGDDRVVVFTRSSDGKEHENTVDTLRIFLNNTKAQLINKHTEEVLGEKYWTKYGNGGGVENELEKEIWQIKNGEGKFFSKSMSGKDKWFDSSDMGYTYTKDEAQKIVAILNKVGYSDLEVVKYGNGGEVGEYVNQYFGKGYESDAINELRKALPNHTFEKGKNSIIVDGGKFIIHLDFGKYGFIRAYSHEGSEGGISVQKLDEAIAFILFNSSRNTYAIGGSLDGGILSEDMQMAKSDVMKLDEYSKKISDSVMPNQDVEAWVISKISKVEQTTANVKHTLEAEYPEMFADGGEIENTDGNTVRMMCLHIGKYAKSMLKAIDNGVVFESWMTHELSIAGNMIDSVFHYLDYFNSGNHLAHGGGIKNYAGGGVVIYKELDLNRRDGKKKISQITKVDSYREAVERIEELNKKNTNPSIRYFTGDIYHKGGGFYISAEEYRDILDAMSSERLAQEYFTQKGIAISYNEAEDEREDITDALVNEYVRTMKSRGERGFKKGGEMVKHLDIPNTMLDFTLKTKMDSGGSFRKENIKTLRNRFEKEKQTIALIIIADDIIMPKLDSAIKQIDWNSLTDSQKQQANKIYRDAKEFYGYKLLDDFLRFYYSNESIKNNYSGQSIKTMDKIKRTMSEIAESYPISDTFNDFINEVGYSKYQLGDMWSDDFDYEGMLQMALTINENWSIGELQSLYDSFEDVNYHTVNSYLKKIIDYIENGNKNLAKAYIIIYKKKIAELLADEYSEQEQEASQMIMGGNLAQKRKVGKVMHEFKHGKLKSNDRVVTDRNQAIAIALSEAGISKKEEGGIISTFKLPSTDVIPLGQGGIPQYNTPLDHWALYYERGGEMSLGGGVKRYKEGERFYDEMGNEYRYAYYQKGIGHWLNDMRNNGILVFGGVKEIPNRFSKINKALL